MFEIKTIVSLHVSTIIIFKEKKRFLSAYGLYGVR